MKKRLKLPIVLRYMTTAALKNVSKFFAVPVMRIGCFRKKGNCRKYEMPHLIEATMRKEPHCGYFCWNILLYVQELIKCWREY
ncbi:hypothetical protein QJ48_00175 [Paenibacillus sp. A3]|nr:hypothetical protein QJ48_00175 [Paenibacillus sp. A3]